MSRNKPNESDETVVSICHWDKTGWLSTTRESVRDRCLTKGWKIKETFNDNQGRPRRWTFDFEADLLSLVPKSRADREKASAKAKAVYAKHPTLHRGAASNEGSVGT